ncbi:unnamed protein product [Clonostachys rosea f. rosea IK726]|uniref:DUF967 domain protein n=2 Tax=Bionectria ochroleuca TaxID=29856 RepID=A0A0B7JX78_BIOOC|nr:unnamed protein product [Clonostachys rosea f. rosea IK726]
MSRQTLRRNIPTGTGLKASLAALESSSPAEISITAPPDTVDALTAQGDSFTLTSFTTADAHELGHLLYARLLHASKPTLISIALASGLVLFQTTTGPGVQPDNETWVQRKRRSVLRFGSSSWFLHCKFAGDEAAFAAKFGLGPDQAGQYAIHGGGVPIRVEGVEGVVAVVVVSGLKQEQDHGVIVDVIKENWVPVN